MSDEGRESTHRTIERVAPSDTAAGATFRRNTRRGQRGDALSNALVRLDGVAAGWRAANPEGVAADGGAPFADRWIRHQQ